jgi:hypothetical protein
VEQPLAGGPLGEHAVERGGDEVRFRPAHVLGGFIGASR